MHSSKTSVAHAWVAAGTELARDPQAKVACPRCGGGPLNVRDALWPDGSKLDRYLQCPQCGATNVMTLDAASPAPATEKEPGPSQ